jgi:hypothetical protein
MTTISAEIYDAITATYDVKDSIISDLQYRYMVARYAKKTDIPKELFVEIVLTAQEIAKKYGAKVESSRLIGTLSIIKFGMVAYQGQGISHLAIAQLIAQSFESGKDDLFISRDNHMYEQIQILYRRRAADGGEFTVHHAGTQYNCHIMMWNSSYKIKITKEEKK